MATAKQVLQELQKMSPADLEKELKIWLPGSTIRLGGMDGKPSIMSFKTGTHSKHLMIEGNLDVGSALGT